MTGTGGVNHLGSLIDTADADMLRLVFPPFADYVLEHGRDDEPIDRPKSIRKRPNKGCFGNRSRFVSLNTEYAYCEGFATPADGGWWIHHAWCVDSHGRAVDLTWRQPGRAYFGVVLDAQTIARLTNAGHWHGTWLPEVAARRV